MRRLALIQTDEKGHFVIKVSHLCFISCKNLINLSHTQYDLAKSVIYRELEDLLPHKLQYIPQGVNPRRWIQCNNPSMASLISDILGDDDEWLLNLESLRQIKPWKSDENFIARFQRVKQENKITFIEQVLESVKFTEYIQVPNPDFSQSGNLDQQTYSITRKRIIIDDVDSFFTGFLESNHAGALQSKDEDLFINFMAIENELTRYFDEQLFKLLSYTFMILSLHLKIR